MIMTSKVTRSEKILSRLASSGLTTHGADFLVAALDPMHDTQLKELVGWPDLETASSVILPIKQSITISNPSLSPTPPNWDCHVIQWPWLNGMQFIGGTRVNNYCSVGSAINFANTIGLGSLCVYIVPAGAALDLSVAPNYALNIPSAYSAGGLRIVGSGFEIINTTAQIYKQGQLAVWRQPNGAMERTHFNTTYGNAGGGAVSRITVDAQVISCPPLTLTDAMLIPGTRQWRASDGAYVVSPHLSAENPQCLVEYTAPIIHITRVADTTLNVPSVPTGFPAANNTGNILFPVQGTGLVGGDYYSQGCRVFPIHQTGCVLTGLSPQTTFTLSWNCYLERFPTIAEPEILVLATPSASYDELAMKLYSSALLSLPIGVPAGENGLGDWFAGVVNKFTDWLTPAAKAAGFRTVAGLSKLAGQASRAYMAPPSPQSIPVAPVKQIREPRRPREMLAIMPPPGNVSNTVQRTATLAQLMKEDKKKKKKKKR